jgi:hypothetical protein
LYAKKTLAGVLASITLSAGLVAISGPAYAMACNSSEDYGYGGSYLVACNSGPGVEYRAVATCWPSATVDNPKKYVFGIWKAEGAGGTSEAICSGSYPWYSSGWTEWR